jgi:hypothetical protein
MAFDAKVFASWNVRTRLTLREILRRKEFRKTTPNLGPPWVSAVSELANSIKKVTQGMLARISENEIDRITKLANPSIDPKKKLLRFLIRRWQDFPRTLSYQITGDGAVLIYSSDRYLEGALYFGTRQLPRLRPIEFIVSRMTLRLQDHSIVFIARDFRKSHETEDDFKKENLRQVGPHYS